MGSDTPSVPRVPRLLTVVKKHAIMFAIAFKLNTIFLLSRAVEGLAL